MDQLWSIALRATDKDVSMAAIQYLNLYYIGYGNGLLEKEEEFIKRCMKNLLLALDVMKQVSGMLRLNYNTVGYFSVRMIVGDLVVGGSIYICLLICFGFVLNYCFSLNRTAYWLHVMANC